MPIQPVAQAGQPGLEGVYPKGKNKTKTYPKHGRVIGMELESEIVKGFFFFFFK